MQARRVFGDAAVLDNGVCAGTIESSSGNASDAPQPRRTVRREICFLVMNMPGLLVKKNTRNTEYEEHPTRCGSPRCSSYSSYSLYSSYPLNDSPPPSPLPPSLPLSASETTNSS